LTTGVAQTLVFAASTLVSMPGDEKSGLAWLAANAVENDALPTDLADQHDCYLYGCPTKDRPL
jgi:hypothetical protein